MSAGFDKSRRILRRDEFLATQKSGRRLHAPHLVVIVRERGDGEPPRLGLVTSKKTGNAVRRNRIRRVLREVFRLHPELFPLGCEVVIIARESCPALAFAEACAEIRAAFARRRGGDRTPRASAPMNPPGSGGAAT